MVKAGISKLLGKITVLLIICCCCLPSKAKYGGGTGEPNDPYQIADANALLELAADTNDYGKCFLMTADVNMQGQSFTKAIIAPHTGGYSEPFQGKAFTGTFDGNGHKITSFNISGLKNWYIGLFGQIDSGGTVRNLGLENFAVNGARYIGCLVGNNVNGSIRNCYSIGQTSGFSESRYIGGLVGYNSGSISNCQSSYQSITYQKVALSNSTDYISGYFSAGGLVGVNSGSISDCWSTASVGGSGGSSAFGGFAGINSGNITSCYSTGTSVGESSVGGFVGSNSGNIINCHSTGQVNGYYLLIGGFAGKNIGSITKCYSTGSVIDSSISQYIGGLVGDNDSGGSISNCFATGAVNDSYNGKYVGGLVGGNYNSSINNCYSTSTVKGNNYIGGLCANNNQGTISQCYAIGTVSGNSELGGLIGYDTDGIYTKNFWDTTVNPALTGIGNTSDPNVIGEWTANMQTQSTFTDAGWDFVGESANGPNDIWKICEGQDYPRLSWEKYGGGGGTAGNPYLIYTSCQMNEIGADPCDWDKHFKLMADIDLSEYTGTEFNIIGNDVNAFTGFFDGNRNTICNFTWRSANDYRIGLFCYLGSNGVIKNLELENVDVNVFGGYMIAGLVAENNGDISGCSLVGTVSGSESWVGGLVASNRGAISDCHVRGSVSSIGAERGDRVGGLVGESYSGGVINCCSSECTVVGDWGLTGGLVGENWSVISNCSSSGIVYGLGDYSVWVGGLVGKNARPIINCYSTSSVSGPDGVGGLVGCTYGQIMDSYSSGNVSGDVRVGGLVGRHQNGLISTCYSRGNVSGNSEVGGLIGYHWSVADAAYLKCFWDSDVNADVNGIGNTTDPNVIGETTVNMQTKITFTDAGWDFVGEIVNGPNDIWDICEGTNYPRFVWQIPPGDFLCPDGVNFFDYSFFAKQWAEDNCAASNDCDGRDLDLLGSVDIKDLRIFVDNWLAGF